jgi:hypothetical protein
MIFQPYATHMAVSASNSTDVLLEINGATTIKATTPAVAPRRTRADDRPRAARIARIVPRTKIARFTAGSPPPVPMLQRY